VFVTVSVVQVGVMRMLMAHGGVMVPVGMRLCRRIARIMLMPVVGVMDVVMLVVERRVPVLVFVRL
jgi:hypothetical protein